MEGFLYAGLAWGVIWFIGWALTQNEELLRARARLKELEVALNRAYDQLDELDKVN